jgi:hypothetical protein
MLTAGSLSDGDYTLTIRADLIHNALGEQLDGDGDGRPGGNRTITFRRLFGDANGDGVVDGSDYAIFRTTFHKHAGDAGFLWYFDYDGNGYIDGLDNSQFARRRDGGFVR